MQCCRPDNCQARRHTDHYSCRYCGLQWDLKDPDPPECRDPKQTGRRVLAQLKALLASS